MGYHVGGQIVNSQVFPSLLLSHFLALTLLLPDWGGVFCDERKMAEKESRGGTSQTLLTLQATTVTKMKLLFTLSLFLQTFK